LVVNSSDPTIATIPAKERARLIAENAPIYVAAEAGNMPRAIRVRVEMVPILAHEICVAVKKGRKGERTPLALSADIAAIYLRGFTAAPLLSNDGGIRVAQGHDPAARI
jgi:hypothetical protein